MNPIFIEYYPHENCDCYKIRNPWSCYLSHTIVLYPTKDGIDKARQLAMEFFAKEIGFDFTQVELQKQISIAQEVIPEGYKVAKDTLPEQVSLMVAGLHAYSKEREELLEEIRNLNSQLWDAQY
jgi:hypothetical protein